MISKHEYNPPTPDPHIPGILNCGCAVCCERDELRAAEIERLKAHVAGAEAVISLGKAW